MAHNRSGADGLHVQAITDSAISVYRCLRGTPIVYTSLKGPEMVKSAPLCGSVSSTAALLSSVVSPSRHLAPPSGLSHNHSIVVTAQPCSHFDARAASAPSLSPRSASTHFLPPPLPLSLRPRAASAIFFAHLPPPIRKPCKSRCTHVRFFTPCVPRPSPFPPPGPCRVFTHPLLHQPASAVDSFLCEAARRMLCLFSLLTIA